MASKNTIYSIGFYSAILSAIFAIVYDIAQLMNLPGKIIGPWDSVFITLPSLLLSFAFIPMMVCIYYYSSEEKKIWSHLGIVFAALYTALVSIAYIVNLAIVVPNMLAGNYEKVAFLDVLTKNSFMMPIDALGYGFMSLSLLFTAQVFIGGTKLELWTGRAFLAHGILGPVIVLALFIPSLIYIGALWMITFPLSAILLAALFRKNR